MLKFIKVSISALLTIILAPIAFLAATLLTDSGKDMSKVATFDKNQLVTNKMVTALSGMDKDNPKLNFTFNNDEMDSLFNYVYEKSIKTTGAGEYIKKFYCDAKDDNRWDFTVVGGWKFFNTKATLPTTLKVENENLVFRFDAPILGRLNTAFACEYIAQLAQSLTLNTLLESSLQKLGIDGIKVDIEKEGTISIPKSGLMDYVAKLQDAQGQSTDSLVGALLSVFTSNSKDMISATTNKEIGLSLDLNNITKAAAEKQGYIAPTRDLLKSFEEGLSGYVDNVKKWADESQKELTEKEITQKLSNAINESGLKRDGTAGAGFLDKVAESINSYTTPQEIIDAAKNGLSLGSIDSIDLFNYLRGNAIAGKTTTFSKKINGKYTINQITVEAIDFRFYNTEDSKPRVSVFVPINVNNVVIMAVLDYEISCDKNDKKTIVFGDEEDINKNAFYIGNKEITGKAKNNFVSLLTEINSNDGTTSNPFQVTNTGAIKIDFCSTMQLKNEIADALNLCFKNGELKIECVDSNDASNDGGKIKFTLKTTQEL